MRKFSFKKKLTDYSKIQSLIGSLIRGNTNFIKSKRIKVLEYLDIGCGNNIGEGFVSLDYSWTPKLDVCWDLTKDRLPFPDNHFKGIYTEHCYEHIPLDNFKENMSEIYRILRPGGTLRLIMPDGELYLDIYNKRKNGEDIKMPYENGYISTIHRINGIFRNHGHQFIYDYATIKIVLQNAGFNQISKVQFKQGKDKRLLRDTEWRAIESLYVEATK